MKTRLCTLYDLTQVYNHSHGQRLGLFFCRPNLLAIRSLPDCPSSLYPRKLRLTPRRAAFSSSRQFYQTEASTEGDENQHRQKRKSARAPAAKNSLRKVAIEAQRSRDKTLKEPAALDVQITTKVGHI